MSRRLATMAAAMLAALVALLIVGAPAHAEDPVRVELRGLPGDMVAGGRTQRIQAIFTNTTDEPRSGVRAVVAVRLEGAPPDAINVQKRSGGGLSRDVAGDGTVIFTDSDPFDLPRDGGQASRQFRLSFEENAPPGVASITIAAYLGGQLLGRTSGSTRVQPPGSGGKPPTSTPPNTDPGIVPTLAEGPSYSIAPLPVAQERSNRDASAPRSLYVLGSLLVGIGVVSLVLIFRSPKRGVAGAAVRAAWPRMSWPRSSPRPEAPTRAWPGAPAPGPAPGVARPIRDPGPTRRVRDPGPGDTIPPWLRP